MKDKGSLTAYRLWAPNGVLWSEWAKPVLFADRLNIPGSSPDHYISGGYVNREEWYSWYKTPEKRTSYLDNYVDAQDWYTWQTKAPPAKQSAAPNAEYDVFEPPPPPEPLHLPEPSRVIDHIGAAAADTAIIVDLPGVKGVDTALALAQRGYRPVPLYNGVCSLGSNAVQTEKIADALIARASELAAIDLDDDAPPVFMLDSDRSVGEPLHTGMFDNRWRVFPQDMPSAAFLKQHGIENVLVCSNEGIDTDLENVLYRYQKQHITIRLYCEKRGIREYTVLPPAPFKKYFYRFMVTLGLKRNAAGGFGGVVPEESESSYGGG